MTKKNTHPLSAVERDPRLPQ